MATVEPYPGEANELWETQIVLDEDESLEDAGYATTGEYGLPGPGQAMATPDHTKIVVRNDVEVDPAAAAFANEIYNHFEWPILEELS